MSEIISMFSSLNQTSKLDNSCVCVVVKQSLSSIVQYNIEYV